MGLYDDALMTILKNEQRVSPFFDAVFDFLYRRTNFFQIGKENEELGFPEGIAEKVTLKAFKKFQLRTIQGDQQRNTSSGSNKQKCMPDFILLRSESDVRAFTAEEKDAICAYIYQDGRDNFMKPTQAIYIEKMNAELQFNAGQTQLAGVVLQLKQQYEKVRMWLDSIRNNPQKSPSFVSEVVMRNCPNFAVLDCALGYGTGLSSSKKIRKGNGKNQEEAQMEQDSDKTSASTTIAPTEIMDKQPEVVIPSVQSGTKNSDFPNNTDTDVTATTSINKVEQKLSRKRRLYTNKIQTTKLRRRFDS